MKIYSREQWGARKPGPLTGDGAKHTMVVHHSAFKGMRFDTFKEQCEVMRNMQRHHMDANGWNDIGYGLVVFQPHGTLKRARTFEGRSLSAVPAAQAGANSGTVPVCVVTDSRYETVKLSTRWELVRIGRKLRKDIGVFHLLGHRDLTSTECPGPKLYRLLPWVRKRANLA